MGKEQMQLEMCLERELPHHYRNAVNTKPEGHYTPMKITTLKRLTDHSWVRKRTWSH